MNEQMYRSIRGAIEWHLTRDNRPADDITLFTVDNVSEGVYNTTSDGKRVSIGEWLPDDNTVLEATVRIPDEELPEGYERTLRVDLSRRDGQLFVDGELYYGIDVNRHYLPIRDEWRGKPLSLRTLSRGHGPLGYLGTAVVDNYARALLFTVDICRNFLDVDDQSRNRDNVYIDRKVWAALDRALLSINADAPDDLFHTQCRDAEEMLRKDLDAIDDGDVRGLISLIGHTHIDVAWLWQLKDTVRKCGHTFSSMLRLMEQYPDFIFTCSQAQLLDYTKRFYPDLFEQIKKRVAEGRWENVGSMWVESDCNVTSGESLVRQILYGAVFEKENFGTHSTVAWLPDTFGFQPNIPQILRRAGITGFYTQKIYWCRKTAFPYNVFRWTGIDGSEIISSASCQKQGYNGNPFPDELRFGKEHNQQEGSFDYPIFPYGWGDGGGGPTSDMIENAHRLADFPGLPKTEFIRADKYFERLSERESELPRYFGELYLENHRGTLTSQGKAKRNNRMAELGCQSDEKLAVLAELLGNKPDWSLMNNCWKRVLTMQFHDILPGSSINEVYTKDCAENYAAIDKARADFIASSGLESGDDMLLAFNTLSWERNAVCEYNAGYELPENTVVVDSDRNILPTIVLSDKKTLLFSAELPAFGTKAFRIGEGAVSEKQNAAIQETDDGLSVETEHYRTVIDRLGRIVSLYDKRADRQVLRDVGNDIKLFIDGPQLEDAWNLYPEYSDREVDCDWKTSISVTENNALRTVIRVVRSINGCGITQDIVFGSGSDEMVEFRTKIDWSLRHRILRVYFPMNVMAQNAAYETGFGTFFRPTMPSCEEDVQKFEVCAHKFADLSDSSYGAALINDCKYGHSCDRNILGLSLLRGTTYPDPNADIGTHEINYALYPHKGSYADGEVPRRAYEFNQPVRLFGSSSEAAEKADGISLLTCDSKDIIIDTVKRSEDRKSIIIRAYESNGAGGKAHISLKGLKGDVYECNLLEEHIGKPVSVGDGFEFEYAPFEIRTFAVE